MSEKPTQSDASHEDLPVEIGTARVEAFSDGVLAVIITIMVLGFRTPASASLEALKPLVSDFLVYVLSFAFIGMYWNNHHHLMRAAIHISGASMWANLFLLFWLSLVPLATKWAQTYPLDRGPAFLYSFIGLMAGIAYFILVRALRAVNKGSEFDRAMSADYKGRASIVLYVAGLLLAGFDVPVAPYFASAVVAVMWFIPDRRLVRRAPPAES